MHTVCYYHRVSALYGFIGHGLGQVDGQEHGVPLSSGGVERCFEEYFSISSERSIFS